MPGSYTLDTDRRVVFSRGWGSLAEAELTAHSRALRADPRFDSAFAQIVDLRDVKTFEVTPMDVRGQAENTPFAVTSRRAFVVASDVGYGMARMYQSSFPGEANGIHIYRDMGEALSWVGLEPWTPWPEGPAEQTFELG